MRQRVVAPSVRSIRSHDKIGNAPRYAPGLHATRYIDLAGETFPEAAELLEAMLFGQKSCRSSVPVHSRENESPG